MNLKENPVTFIIGTGRCGSSLLLRMLQTNKKLICVDDELNVLWHPHSYPFASRRIDTPPYMADPHEFTSLSLAGWPENHSEKIRRTVYGHAEGKEGHHGIVVKSVMISFMLPVLMDIFPGAKFIHVIRYGLSVVSSFLRKEWPKYQDHYKGDLAGFSRHISSCWISTLDEMDRLKEQEARFDVLELRYEQLVDDPEKVMEGIARHIGTEKAFFSMDGFRLENKNYKSEEWMKESYSGHCMEIMQKQLEAKKYR